MSLPQPVVIFVRPQNAGNLGALARAMSNFSCKDLRIVGERPTGDATEEFSKMDWAMACKGQPILETAQVFGSLAEASSDLNVLMGTSGKDANFDLGYARPFVSPDEGFEFARQQFLQVVQTDNSDSNLSKNFQWALVLGCESDGLSAEEAAMCSQLINIPTSSETPSINAAMAGAFLLYHFNFLKIQESSLPSSQTRPQTEGAFELQEKENWSSVEDKERFLDYLVETLNLTQFFKYPDQESVRGRFRRFLQGTQIPRGELLLVFEALYQLKSWGEGKFEKRDFLGRE